MASNDNFNSECEYDLNLILTIPRNEWDTMYTSPVNVTTNARSIQFILSKYDDRRIINEGFFKFLTRKIQNLGNVYVYFN